jgi:hypothetical protein
MELKMHQKQKCFLAYIMILPVERSSQKARLLDTARREADRMGRFGIEAKRGQTDARYRKRGCLAFRFPNKVMAQSYRKRIRQLNEPRLHCTLRKSNSLHG